jgi:hypothetical protein
MCLHGTDPTRPEYGCGAQDRIGDAEKDTGDNNCGALQARSRRWWKRPVRELIESRRRCRRRRARVREDEAEQIHEQPEPAGGEEYGETDAGARLEQSKEADRGRT